MLSVSVDSPYKVSLPAYDGPLDLLLHLIRENRIDIYDIPMALLTQQYLDYLHLMESLNLEVAGEWLVMAATLVEIKSRLLLPKNKYMADDGEEDSDPREELVAQLIEYEKIKGAAVLFRVREDMQSKVFVRGAEPDFTPKISLDDITTGDLITALQNALSEAAGEPVTTLQRRKITLRMRIAELWQRLRQAAGQLLFRDLYDESDGRTGLVMTFLALLELIKMGRAKTSQTGTFEPIRVKSAGYPAVLDGETR